MNCQSLGSWVARVSIESDSTIELLALTIDNKAYALNLRNCYVFSEVASKFDCLVVLHCIDSSLESKVLGIVDSCNREYLVWSVVAVSQLNSCAIYCVTSELSYIIFNKVSIL